MTLEEGCLEINEFMQKEKASESSPSIMVKKYTERIDKFKRSEFIQRIHSINPEIKETVSSKAIAEEIITLTRRYLDVIISEEAECTPEILEDIFNKYLGTKPTTAEIVYGIEGAIVNAKAMKLGSFYIYSKEGLFEKFSYLKKGDFLNKYAPQVYVGIEVTARDRQKKVDIADDYIQSFENVLNFLCFDDFENFRSGIFNQEFKVYFERILCDSGKGWRFQTTEVLQPIKMHGRLLISKDKGYNMIWDLITKENKTEIEKKIIISSRWAGKSRRQQYEEIGFIQLLFSIESMLSLSEGTKLNPSKINQIGKFLAIIIADESVERMNVLNNFKRFYAKGCEIVYNDLTYVSPEDYDLTMKYCQKMISAFLTKSPFNKMKTLKQVQAYIRQVEFP